MLTAGATATSTRRTGGTVDRTWMKNHPLEGDDVILGFYDLLCKRNPKTMKPCRNVFVPDTVVFEHNFPRGWYTTDVKAREVARKQGKELDAATIEAGFSRGVHASCPIVALYLSTHERDLGDGGTETTTQVEVFNRDDVGAFLARKNKREGILQRFVYPKGYHNSVIQVVWSPRICMVQRRTNKLPMMDRKRAESDPFAITVTYEGPEHLSDEGTVSAHVAFEAKSICADIVTHFFYTEHKYITRMVLYFKSDAKDRLWLLWCGSLRVAERKSPSEMPVNLAARFSEPRREGELDEDGVLRTTDQAYFLVTRDEFFYETFVRGARGVAGGRAAQRHTAELAGATGAAAAALAAGDALERRGTADEPECAGAVARAVAQLRAQEAEVLDALGEVFYRAYSHFLRLDPAPFELAVPANVLRILTDGRVVDLLRALRLRPTRCSDGAGESDEANGAAGLMCVIPPNHPAPLTKMRDDMEQWVRRHFDALVEALRHDYASGGACADQARESDAEPNAEPDASQSVERCADFAEM